ncbi:MAG: hypothetical protein IH881_03845 [Myxococcales bacterium]|nr:hypothetical protein [Myxococcales bacterium]
MSESDSTSIEPTATTASPWLDYLDPRAPQGRILASHLLLALCVVAPISPALVILAGVFLGVVVATYSGSRGAGLSDLLASIDAAGRGDFRCDPGVASGEVGKIASSLSDLFGKLRSNLTTVVSSGGKLDTGLQTLTSDVEAMAHDTRNIRETAESVAGVTGEMGSNINTVAAAVEEFSSNVRNVATAVEEMSANLVSISNNAATMTNTVDSAESAVTAMQTSMVKVTENSTHAVEIAERATGTATRSDQIISALGQSAQEIGKVISVIDDIAAQTNLLALNATIEAASARSRSRFCSGGERGEGTRQADLRGDQRNCQQGRRDSDQYRGCGVGDSRDRRHHYRDQYDFARDRIRRRWTAFHRRGYGERVEQCDRRGSGDRTQRKRGQR